MYMTYDHSYSILEKMMLTLYCVNTYIHTRQYLVFNNLFKILNFQNWPNFTTIYMSRCVCYTQEEDHQQLMRPMDSEH